MNSEDILQRCLEDMAAGRRTAAECAAQYPQMPDLLEQLQAAAALRAWTSLTVSPAAANRHQAQLRAALAATRTRRPAAARWPQWALAATLVAVLVLGGFGTINAAASSLPGQAFYTIKRAAESVQGAFIAAKGQAAWHTYLAEARTAELEALAAAPSADPALLEQLARNIGTETDTALAAIPQAASGEQAALLESLLAQIGHQVTVLRTVRAKAPAQAQSALDLALTVSAGHQTAALDQLAAVGHRPDSVTATVSAGRATMTPPGRTRPTVTTAAPAATRVPPGQAKKTATATDLPATDLPPGQERKTATAAAVQATNTPPGNSEGGGPPSTPNCRANNPNSPNYCTPTPGSAPSGGGSEDATATIADSPPPPTPCPLNPAGKPVCGPRP